jgi:carbonic anhydrase/acetyltransferase-like protein (isoleucine patch superfamily)
MIGNGHARLFVAVIAIALPGRWRRAAMVRLLGYDIAPDASVGRSLILVDRLVMKAESSIGSLNLIKNCDLVELGETAIIGHLNWITGIRRQDDSYVGRPRRRTLRLGDGAGITHLHFIDCCDLVDVGEFSLLSGVRSQVLTHGIDLEEGALTCAPVRIGSRVLICSGVVLVAGCRIADRTVIGAGALVTGHLAEAHMLYTGVPARPKRPLDPAAGVFTRQAAHFR